MTVRMVDPRRANVPFYLGLSTDKKPTTPVPNADSRFYETDTGQWFIYTGEDWVERRDVAQGPIPSSAEVSVERLLEEVVLELHRIRRLLEVGYELNSDDLVRI